MRILTDVFHFSRRSSIASEHDVTGAPQSPASRHLSAILEHGSYHAELSPQVRDVTSAVPRRSRKLPRQDDDQLSRLPRLDDQQPQQHSTHEPGQSRYDVTEPNQPRYDVSEPFRLPRVRLSQKGPRSEHEG